MNAIIIPTSVCFAQIEMLCNLTKRVRRIGLFVEINHLTPKRCFFGETNAVGGMNLDRSHEIGGERCA